MDETILASVKEIGVVLQSLGVTGTEAFITYLWFSVGEIVLSGIGGLSALGAILYTVYRITLPFRDESRLRTLRDAMGVGIPGPLLDSEYRRMLEWVKEHRSN